MLTIWRQNNTIIGFSGMNNYNGKSYKNLYIVERFTTKGGQKMTGVRCINKFGLVSYFKKNPLKLLEIMECPPETKKNGTPIGVIDHISRQAEKDGHKFYVKPYKDRNDLTESTPF